MKMDNACFVVFLFIGSLTCALAMPAGLIVQEDLPQTAVDMTTILPESQDEPIVNQHETNTAIPIILGAVPVGRALANEENLDMTNEEDEDMEGAETIVFRPLFRYRQVSRRRAQQAARRRFSRYSDRRRPLYYYYY